MHRLQVSVLGFVLAALGACGGGNRLGQDVDNLEVALADIGFVQAGLLEQEIDLSLRFTNPNPVEIASQGMRFDMDLGGGEFAKGVYGEPLNVPALGELTVPVKVRVSTVDLIERLVELGTGGPLPYAFKGEFFVDQDGSEDPVPLPFSGEATIRLPDIDGLISRFGAAQG